MSKTLEELVAEPLVWYCHDCKCDQITHLDHKIMDGEKDRWKPNKERIAPRIDFQIWRCCSVCGGRRLGIEINFTMDAEGNIIKETNK